MALIKNRFDRAGDLGKKITNINLTLSIDLNGSLQTCLVDYSVIIL